MDQQQKELRYAAAQAFMESLTHLQQTLQEPEPESPADPGPSAVEAVSHPPVTDADSTFDLSSFEQAAADIEQFMQTREATDPHPQ